MIIPVSGNGNEGGYRYDRACFGLFLVLILCCLAPSLVWAESLQPASQSAQPAAMSVLATTAAALTPQGQPPAMPVAVPAAAPVTDAGVAFSDQYDAAKIARHYAGKFRQDADYVLGIVNHAAASARKYNVSPFVLLAIIAHESQFRATARNGAGAEGLMQIVTKVHKKRFTPYGGPGMTFVPEVNIQVGAGILSECMGGTKTVSNGLRCYAGAFNTSFVNFTLREAALLEKMAALPADGVVR